MVWIAKKGAKSVVEVLNITLDVYVMPYFCMSKTFQKHVILTAVSSCI